MAKRNEETLIIRKDGVLMASQHVAADICGVTTLTINRWLKEANPPPRTAEGLYPVKELCEWSRKMQTKKQTNNSQTSPLYGYAPEGWAPKAVAQLPLPLPTKNPDGVTIGGETLKEAETRHKIAQADKIEMEMAKEAGTLIPAAEVLEAWQRILTRVKTRLLKLPMTLAPMVLGDPDLHSVQRKLKESVNDALAEASVDWRETQEAADDDE